MARVALGVTGSVAAIRTPALVEALTAQGHAVRVVATGPALYFFDADTLAARGVRVHRDEDEWPGERYERGDPVLHIELRDWAEVLVIAPLDAHTLGRLALGLSDNLLACVLRAWDFDKPLVLAPAMNTRMWESPVTLRHLRQVFEDHAGRAWEAAWTLDDAAAAFAAHAPRILLIPPQAKRLACGDVGMGAMAEVVTIAEAVRAWGEEAASRG
jgi:phosphopantothenoylcysteine decarboxylase